MKGIFRLAVSLYIVVICLIVLNIFFSPEGVISYSGLKSYKETIEQNITELTDINSSLILDSEKLMNQSEEIKVQARELGWVEENEGIIVVKGYEKTSSGYSIGRLLSREHNAVKRSYNNFLIAMIIGISFYIFSGFFRERKS